MYEFFFSTMLINVETFVMYQESKAENDMENFSQHHDTWLLRVNVFHVFDIFII